MNYTVTEIQRFCMHDGPGVRTTVFFKGCPLRCLWCHNPETQQASPQLLFYPKKCIGCGGCAAVCPVHAHKGEQVHEIDREACLACGACANACPTGALEICGKAMTADEILSEVERDRAFYGEHGGITLSGGEPLMQEGIVDLLRECKKRGLSTAVETCGMVPYETVAEAIPVTDLFLWDVKDTNAERHKKYTGASNRTILENLTRADKDGAKTRLRCILVNGVNTEDEHYRKVADLAASLSHCEGVEFLPYHAYAGTKATFLGLKDNGVKEWIPTDEQVAEAKDFLRSHGLFVF